MAQQDIKALLEKIQSGKFTPEEERIAKYWLLKLEQQEATDLTDEEVNNISQEMWECLQGLQAIPSKTRRLWPRIAAAASILIACVAGLYVYQHKPKGFIVAQVIKQDIAPGHNQATLTLANGQKIVLTKNLQGQIATQGRTSITANGQHLTYQNTQKEDLVSYNTMSTATGEQSPYPLVLADGTKVWLNAESSITFPTAFIGNERVVKLTGEAYFEVKHDAKQPFKVQTGKQTIEDIGTSFDVNAYSDEASTRTTLVEGSVKINSTILKPNQQYDGSVVKTVNVKRFIAWKDGDFYFKNDGIQTIMRDLARWYNIQVLYEGKITDDGFNAEISKNKNINSILHTLENTGGVKFKVEGRRVTVIE